MANANPVQIATKQEKSGVSKAGKAYSLTEFSTTSGLKFGLFAGRDPGTVNVNKKDITINVGDTVQLIYETVGKNTKVLDAQVISEATMTQQEQLPKEMPRETFTVSTSAKGPAPSVTFTAPPTSKDLSMELSGIIQSLISTGNYHDKVQKTLDNGREVTNTYILTDLLTTHLKLVLAEKDKVAAERSQA